MPPFDITRSSSINLETLKTNMDYTASLLIDMLTIALGPEHHDIKIIDSRTRGVLGRFKCNLNCNHIAPIFVSIDSIICRLHEKPNSKISYKLNYKDIEHQVESDYSCENDGKISSKSNETIYRWFKENTKEKVDLIQIDNVRISFKYYYYLLITNII